MNDKEIIKKLKKENKKLKIEVSSLASDLLNLEIMLSGVYTFCKKCEYAKEDIANYLTKDFYPQFNEKNCDEQLELIKEVMQQDEQERNTVIAW